MLALASAAYAASPTLPDVIGEFTNGSVDGWQGNYWGGTEVLTSVQIQPGYTLDPDNDDWQLQIANFGNGWGPACYLDITPASDPEALRNFSPMKDLHLVVAVIKEEWDLGDFGWMNIVEDVIVQSNVDGWYQVGGKAVSLQVVTGSSHYGEGQIVPLLEVDPRTNEPGIKDRQSELWWNDPAAWTELQDGRHIHKLDLDVSFCEPGGNPLEWARLLIIAMTSGAARGEDIAPVPMMGNFYLDSVVMTPEPATIALLGLGGLALLRRKHA